MSCPTGELAINDDFAPPLERRWYNEHPGWFSQPPMTTRTSTSPTLAARHPGRDDRRSGHSGAVPARHRLHRRPAFHFSIPRAAERSAAQSPFLISIAEGQPLAPQDLPTTGCIS